MAIIFSKGCEYGLQAVLFIATQEGRRVGIREAAEELRIPVHFLAKILQTLSERGVLTSFKGVGGGFTLAQAPEQIHLIDIVSAIDGLDLFTHCVMGFPNCGEGKPCPVHSRWGGIRDVIRTMLTEDSVADLMETSREKFSEIMTRYSPEIV